MPTLLLPIIGRRLTIRSPTIEDIESWYDLEADAEVKKYLNGPTSYNKKDWINGMRSNLQKGVRQSVIELNSSKSFVGRLAIDQINWELEIVIARAYWGKKFGEEAAKLIIDAAFTSMGTSAIFAVIHPCNDASKRLVMKLGFVEDGKKDSEGWDNGHLIFSLTEDTFRAAVQKVGPS